MTDTRKKDVRWKVTDDSGVTREWNQVQVAVLMGIRDEMQQINRFLGCHRIPKALDAVVAMHKQGVKRRVVRKRVKK